jgi:hypothetical protein
MNKLPYLKKSSNSLVEILFEITEAGGEKSTHVHKEFNRRRA